MRDDDGANAVEFALILPLLVILLFGAITFGLAFNGKLQLNHATREAVRYAATLPDGTSDAWFEDVLQRLVVISAGQASPRDGSLVVCISVESDSGTYRWQATGNTAYGSAAAMVAANPSTGPAASHCYADGLSDHRVQVTLRRDARLDAVFFRDTVTLSTQAVARYEKGTAP